MHLHSIALTITLGVGCTSHDVATGKPPESVIPTVQLRATVASVQLLGDCPDPEPDAEAAKQKPSAEWVPDGVVPGPSCTQSTMQLALAHDGKDAQRVEVGAIRLVRADKPETLATLASRKPSKWNATGIYDAWDERVPVGAETKVSYRLAAPNWAEVQTKLIDTRNDTFDQRYVLEVDLKMAGKTTTVRSAEFGREREDVMET